MCNVWPCRSEPSRSFKISVTGSKADIKVKGNKTVAELSAAAADMAAAAATSNHHLHQQTSQHPSRARGGTLTAVLPGSKSAYDAAAAGGAPPSSAVSSGMPVYDPEVPWGVPVQRQYEFAVEVWAAPSEGPFKVTKVVSIKSKYILFNDTGMVLEYKQRNTPDATHPGYDSYGEGRRFAGLLQPQER